MMPGGLCELDIAARRQVNCIRVESNFLKTLGIAPALGRDFAREEDRFNGPRVGLLSFGLWRDAFGANPATVSQTIDLDEQQVRVIGILPVGFKMPQGADPDILLLEQWDEHVARAPDSTIFLRAFARLKDGLSLEQARARLAPLFQESVAKYVPAALRPEVRLVVQSIHDRQIHEYKLGSWMLLGAVLALLLLACANVAKVMLPIYCISLFAAKQPSAICRAC